MSASSFSAAERQQPPPRAARGRAALAARGSARRGCRRFAAAGANIITVHVEENSNLYRTLRAIDEAGATPSVTLNPGTSLSTLEPVIPIVRQVLIMSVDGGCPGVKDVAAGIIGGYDLGKVDRSLDHHMLICATELNDKSGIDRLIATLN